MNNVVVTLNWAEMALAGMIATMRRVAAMKRNAMPRYGAPAAAAWDMEMNSVLTEMAVAKHFNLYYHPAVGEIDRPDVGDLIEVRSRRLDHHSLILHPDDSDDLPFVLVHDNQPHFELIGWIMGRDGKRPEYWSDPTGCGRPAFFVPGKLPVLRPIEQLEIRPRVQEQAA